MPEVGRISLGGENDGQERMVSIDVSNDAKNRVEFGGLKDDCVRVTGQPQHLFVVVGQNTSAFTGTGLYICPRIRGGEHRRDHQLPAGPSVPLACR